MIYFDNAATSFPKPPSSIRAMTECMKEYCGNPGRSGHQFSEKTGYMIYQARQNIGKLLHIKDWDRIIFTHNCTESLNMAIKGTLKEGDHVIATSLEHNSVLRPLEILRKRGVQNSIVQADAQGHISPEDVKRKIRSNTKMIICTHSSNVIGTLLPIGEIGRLARSHGSLFLVDAAQTAGACNIDVEEMCIDLLAAPGHKSLLGPQGTGILYVGENVSMAPFKEGGTGNKTFILEQPRDFPDGYEAGTVNSPGIIGLSRSVEYIMATGIDRIRNHEVELVRRIQEGMEKGIKEDRIVMYGDPNPENRTGVVAFNFVGIPCEETAKILNDKYRIAVRSGFHCAPLTHMTIGTSQIGCVRISVGPFNTVEEVKVLAKAIRDILNSDLQ